GIDSYFSEINPFMAFVTETKINTIKEVLKNKKQVLSSLENLLETILQENVVIENITTYDGFEKYFKPEVLNDLLAIKKLINERYNGPTSRIAMLGLASITVTVSNMIKRGDLRYAKENEKKSEDFDVYLQF